MATSPQKLGGSILAILDRSTIIGSTLVLPPKLDRKDYLAVNDVLECLGGKWDRRAKAHVFESDPADLVAAVLETGEYTDPKKVWQFFETPKPLARRMLEEVAIRTDPPPSWLFCEPSAGHGAIAEEIRRAYPNNGLILIDMNPECAPVLQSKGFANVCTGDFLLATAVCFNVIVMNPPFHGGQDVTHITHAFSLLAPGGILVAISSESPFFRIGAKWDAFRRLVGDYGTSEKLPADTFRESGTGVNTRLVILQKRYDEAR